MQLQQECSIHFREENMFCLLKVLSLTTKFFRMKYDFVNSAALIVSLVTALYIEGKSVSSVTLLGGACFLLKCKCIKTIECKRNHLTLPYCRRDGCLSWRHQGNQINNISLMSVPMFVYFTGGWESFFMMLFKSWLLGMITNKKLTHSFVHSHILEISSDAHMEALWWTMNKTQKTYFLASKEFIFRLGKETSNNILATQSGLEYARYEASIKRKETQPRLWGENDI